MTDQMTTLEKAIFEAGIANEQIDIASNRVSEMQEKINEAVEEYVAANFATERDIIEHESTILNEAKSRLREQKKLAKKAAMEIFEETGEKSPNPVIQVKEYVKPELEVDEGAAVAWAVEKNLDSLLQLNADKYRDQLYIGTFSDQPGELLPVVKTSFYTSRLQEEYERLVEEKYGLIFEPLDQIAYIPNHAQGDIHHKDVEFGFVTSVEGGGVFCRFWLPYKVGKELRTKANSERCYSENLVRVMTATPEEVKETWEEIQAGAAEIGEEAKDLVEEE